MNLGKVQVVDLMVSKVVTEQLNWFLNAGYTLVKVKSGGLNNATRVYYLVNMDYCQNAMLSGVSYPVTLLISRSNTQVSKRVQGVDLFEVAEYKVGYTTITSEDANTSFLDSLYKKNEWNIIFEGYTVYGSDVVHPSLDEVVKSIQSGF